MNHGVQPTNMGRISRCDFCAGTVLYVIVQMALFFSTVQCFVFLAAVQKSIPN